MLLLASAAGAFLVYVLDRQWGRDEDRVNHPDRERWWLARGRVRWIVVGVLAGVAVWAGLQLPVRVLVVGLGLGAIGLAYVGPWGQWSLKRLSGRARFVVVALVWGVAVVVLPGLASAAQSGPGSGAAWSSLVLLAAYRTAWLIPNTLAAEYHGREGDRTAGMQNVTRDWTRASLTRWTWMAVVAATVLAAALLVVLPSGVRWILITDGIGLLAMGVYIGRVGDITGSVIFVLDLMVMWPVVPALFMGAN